ELFCGSGASDFRLGASPDPVRAAMRRGHVSALIQQIIFDPIQLFLGEVNDIYDFLLKNLMKSDFQLSDLLFLDLGAGTGTGLRAAGAARVRGLLGGWTSVNERLAR